MRPRLQKILLHPIMMMVVLVLLCRVVKNAYPFNSFPMYADPSPHPSDYLVVADAADGKAVDVKKLTGLSSAKVKKIYTERLNRTTDKLGLTPQEATPELKQKVFGETMRQLREAAVKRKKAFPEKVRITNMLIYQDYVDGRAKFREEPVVFGEG